MDSPRLARIHQRRLAQRRGLVDIRPEEMQQGHVPTFSSAPDITFLPVSAAREGRLASAKEHTPARGSKLARRTRRDHIARPTTIANTKEIPRSSIPMFECSRAPQRTRPSGSEAPAVDLCVVRVAWTKGQRTPPVSERVDYNLVDYWLNNAIRKQRNARTQIQDASLPRLCTK
jgi:hypothetical protein